MSSIARVALSSRRFGNADRTKRGTRATASLMSFTRTGARSSIADSIISGGHDVARPKARARESRVRKHARMSIRLWAHFLYVRRHTSFMCGGIQTTNWDSVLLNSNERSAGGFARARRSLTALWRQWNNRAVTETRGTNWWQIICVHAPWQDAASAEINYSFIALGGEGNADGKTMSRTVKSMMTTTLLKTAWQALFIVWYKYHCNKRMHDLEIKNTPPGWRNNDFSEST